MKFSLGDLELNCFVIHVHDLLDRLIEAHSTDKNTKCQDGPVEVARAPSTVLQFSLNFFRLSDVLLVYKRSHVWFLLDHFNGRGIETKDLIILLFLSGALKLQMPEFTRVSSIVE